MKALILNALKPNEDMGILPRLKNLLVVTNCEVKIFDCREMEVNPCTSCGHCATKTPGRCSIRDDMELIYRSWTTVRLVIFCTPIVFGGYHSSLKLIQDRLMPMNTALFTVRKGELHHENRYRPSPSLMTVGIIKHCKTKEKEAKAEKKINKDAQKKAFEYLTERNAINMNIDKWASVVAAYNDTLPQELLRQLSQAIKEVV